MVKDELTMANINLYAVLQNLEDLCTLDWESKSLIADKNIAIQFSVKNGPKALLSFKHGKCRLQRGLGKSDISLYFHSPEHLNKMFEGKSNPIPLKGLTKISFLKNEFTKLTDRLSYFLKPTDDLLKDATYFNINTILTAYTAFFSLAEIGNSDPMGKLNAGRMPEGVIGISVSEGDLSLHLLAQRGYLAAGKGTVPKPRAMMIFSDMKTINGMLNNQLDAYTCIANGSIETKGFVPMLDNLNKLLSQVPAYLK